MKLTAARLFMLATLSSPAQAAETYDVEIWARVLFGTDGTVSTLEFPNDQTQPKLFLKILREKLLKSRIVSPQIDGQPATLKTGVLVTVLLNRPNSESSFQIRSVRPSPLLVSQKFDGFPSHIFAEDGAQISELKASCVVQISGKCKDIRITRPGTPAPAKEFVRNSLEQWQFEPQEINGNPSESEYRVTFKLLLER